MCLRLALVWVALLLTPSLFAQPSEVDQVLLDAATAGDTEALLQALEAGASPEAADTSGATVLMLATRQGSLETVRALVDAGADFQRKGVLWLDSIRTGYYGNLTGIAAGEGHTDVLTYLLDDLNIPVDDRERDPQTGYDTGWTALQWAASTGQTDAVTLLLERGAVVDRESDTLLVLAIRGSHTETVEALLEAGAPVQDAGGDGLTALHWASARLSATWVTRLQEAGADPNVVSLQGMTPLSVAAMVGNIYSARMLVCAGANGIQFALNVAEENSQTTVAEYLRSVLAEHPNQAACTVADRLAEVHDLTMRATSLAREIRYMDALPLLQEALQLEEVVLGLEHPGLAQSLTNLGDIQRVIGNYTEARLLYERVLMIYNSNLDEDDIRVASILNKLAEQIYLMGGYS